jgi:diguanylate cyclase (GGDEF)-like protein/PAS domain S-box-containing protein
MDEVINKRICDMQKEEAEYLSIFSIKAICMVPIFSHGDFWGAVVLIDRTTNEYFEDGSAEANILQVAARIIAKAIIRAEAEEYTRLMLDTGPLCCQLWDRDFKIIDCNEAAVKLYGYKSKKEYIERWTFECSPLNQPDGQKSVNKAIALIDKVFTTGETAVFEWMQQMPDGTPFPAEITLSRVRYKDDYIVAGYTRDLRELKTLKEKAEEIYYDALTGLYNRRYLDKELNNLIKSISRSRGTLSIMMIDIDRFKQYNDTYGHSEGDKCLKLVAEVLSKSMTRKADFVVRYGGEEFLIALPNTDVNGAHIMAEKLLDNMRKAQIPHKDSDVADHVTISIGVTTGNVTYTQNESDYIKKADEMLYISKQGGRDRYTYQGL